MPILIEIKDMCRCQEDGRVIFEDASITLSGGDRAVVKAPLASGKSDLLRMIAGLIEPDKGTVTVFGTDWAALDREGKNQLRRRMGFVLQDSVLISNLKVIENVALPLLYHSGLTYEECMERAYGMLEKTRFRPDIWSLPGPLPLYAKKEAVIARALVLEPDIVVCENLTAGMMDEEKTHLTGLLSGYQDEKSGRLLVFSSTDESEEELVRPTRVVKIENNALIEENP